MFNYTFFTSITKASKTADITDLNVRIAICELHDTLLKIQYVPKLAQ